MNKTAANEAIKAELAALYRRYQTSTRENDILEGIRLSLEKELAQSQARQAVADQEKLKEEVAKMREALKQGPHKELVAAVKSAEQEAASLKGELQREKDKVIKIEGDLQLLRIEAHYRQEQ